MYNLLLSVTKTRCTRTQHTSANDNHLTEISIKSDPVFESGFLDWSKSQFWHQPDHSQNSGFLPLSASLILPSFMKSGWCLY